MAKASRKIARNRVKKRSPISEYMTKVHPWRICPPGQHWRSPAEVDEHLRLGKPVRAHHRSGTCGLNPSGKDQLYPEEMHEIAERSFGRYAVKPLKPIENFEEKNDYDYLIQGWTKYWNEVLKPDDPLDPNLVKALIASESNLSICAGIRWLFRKKELTEALQKRKISWRDAVIAYKGLDTPKKLNLIKKFDKFYGIGSKK